MVRNIRKRGENFRKGGEVVCHTVWPVVKAFFLYRFTLCQPGKNPTHKGNGGSSFPFRPSFAFGISLMSLIRCCCHLNVPDHHHDHSRCHTRTGGRNTATHTEKVLQLPLAKY